MLSSVLNSPAAIAVNIRIIRIFTKLQNQLTKHKDIFLKLEQLEKKMLEQGQETKKQEEEIEKIFKVLTKLVEKQKKEEKDMKPWRRIGYRV